MFTLLKYHSRKRWTSSLTAVRTPDQTWVRYVVSVVIRLPISVTDYTNLCELTYMYVRTVGPVRSTSIEKLES